MREPHCLVQDAHDRRQCLPDREEKHAETKDFGCDIGPVLRGDVGCTEMVELARLESRNEIQRVGYQKVVKTCQKTTNDGLG